MILVGRLLVRPGQGADQSFHDAVIPMLLGSFKGFFHPVVAGDDHGIAVPHELKRGGSRLFLPAKPLVPFFFHRLNSSVPNMAISRSSSYVSARKVLVKSALFLRMMSSRLSIQLISHARARNRCVCEKYLLVPGTVAVSCNRCRYPKTLWSLSGLLQRTILCYP